MKIKRVKSVSDEDGDKAVHKKFLDSIKNVTKSKQIQKPTRSEIAAPEANDEFYLNKSTNRSAGLSVTKDIFDVLKKKNQHVSVAKELVNTKKTKKVLKKKLEAPVANRIQRTIGYEASKKKLAKWDPIVAANLSAESQVFPLPTDVIEREATKEKLKRTIKSDLMADMEVIEAKLKPAQLEEQQLSAKAQQALDEKNLTKEEILAKRRELTYLKIRYAQKCAKHRQQKKIKSKSYHKFLRRQKQIAEMKESALLEKTDPDAVLKKLESAERSRVLERASLKHRSTGAWAKNVKARAGNNEDLKKDLADQILLSRELTKKRQVVEEESEDEEEDKDDEEMAVDDDGDYDPMNPWVKIAKSAGKKVNEEKSNYRKYWAERNANEEALSNYKKGSDEEEGSDDLKNLRDLSFKNTSMRPDFDEELIETPNKDAKKIDLNVSSVKVAEQGPEVASIDPNKFTEKVKKTFKTFNLHEDAVESNDEDDEDDTRKVTLADAFEDDDIVADFEKERSDQKQEKEIDLYMPGWGSWVTPSNKNQPKTKRLVLKFDNDKNKRPVKENVTINDVENKKFKEHLVSDLPFPFTSVQEYEASIRAPIGRSFVPETAFKALTRPAVITKKGAIINPMDESILVKGGGQKKRPSTLDKRINAVKNK